MLLDIGVIDLINSKRGRAHLSASEHVPSFQVTDSVIYNHYLFLAVSH